MFWFGSRLLGLGACGCLGFGFRGFGVWVPWNFVCNLRTRRAYTLNVFDVNCKAHVGKTVNLGLLKLAYRLCHSTALQGHIRDVNTVDGINPALP